MSLSEGNAAILLLAGRGCRFQDEVPKQFHRLSGKRLYQYALETLQKSGLFQQIILVVPDEYRHLVEEEELTIVSGGATRQESSYRGLFACHPNTKIVLIHDGVRPFVSERILADNVRAAREFGAVDTCIPSNDTIVHSVSGHVITGIPKRAHYLRGQTPQTFRFDWLLEAHQAAAGGDATDDCQLVLNQGHAVHIVPGCESNIKVTYPIDLFLAERLLRERFLTDESATSSLKGKLFAIAGGTGGIGRAIAAKLSDEGARCLIIGQQSGDYQVDLSHYESVRTLFERIESEEGELDGLIHCAGFLQVKELENLDNEEIERVIRVNFNSAVYCAKWAPIRSGGHLILLSSSSCFRGRKNYSLYSAAKAAVVNFAQAMAEEKPQWHVNVCIPSRTRTEMRIKNFPEDAQAEWLEPEEVAEAVVKIAQSDRLTGLSFEIKKGQPYGCPT